MAQDSSGPKEPKRGTLKIYLGAAPGVGKTCAMLAEAHLLSSSGKDVVVALVEDHGREYTQNLVGELEVLPRLHGVGKGELDVQGVIARHPDIAIVDEFAHSNPRGSVHAKRWADIQDILAAGIDVISTMNIQHLESLNDVVSQITGITQQETVPDQVVRAAENIELVDLSPEFLRTRLSDGLIYGADRIGPALGNYFRLGNLTALRELALLWLADQVDDALARYRAEQRITDTWETRERVVVAVENASHAEPLIRRGRRIATKSSAELLVVHVISGDAFMGSTSTLPRLRELSADVGATLHQITGDSVPEALLDFARSANATQLVLGATPRSRYTRILGESVSEEVLRLSGRIDCHMVNLPPKRKSHFPDLKFRHTSLLDSALRWTSAVLSPIAVTAFLYFAHLDDLGTGTISAFYFAAILGVSLLAGLWPALLTGLLSGLAVNWFFTPPLYTFDIAEPGNTVVLIVMMATALAVALLVQRAEAERRRATSAAREADLLTIFSRTALTQGSLEALLQKVADVFGCAEVEARTVAEDGTICQVARDFDGEVEETIVDSHDESIRLILRGRVTGAEDRAILIVIADHVAGLQRQERLAEEAAKANAIAAADELRRALLTSVSHDLRSPLATAKLAASSLKTTEVEFSEEDKEDLLESLEESIDQLSVLVVNLLDSSRLAAGVVTPRKDLVGIAEVVHRAVASCAFGKSAETMERVQVQVGGETCIGDAALLERVLANLLDNSLRYAPSGPVVISASHSPGSTTIAVADSGPGIPREFQETMFQPFQRLGDTNNDTGVGLGLSVVRGFVEAMNGTVHYDGRMILTLPGSADD